MLPAAVDLHPSLPLFPSPNRLERHESRWPGVGMADAQQETL